mmetsp:Transcript_21918/g.50519  ORF Transcript_21918/g.50519 Transcript_21918/m.50519 type:complete len:208 (-) Transcript_21918:370-993(-)
MLACKPSIALKIICLTPIFSATFGLVKPASSSTSRRSTPFQTAVLIAPNCQAIPDVLAIWLNPPRRLPPHWMVVVTSVGSKRSLSPSRLSLSSPFRLSAPNPSSLTVSIPRPFALRAYSAPLTSGTGWWCRMNQRSAGVTQSCMARAGGSSALAGLVLWKSKPGCRSGSDEYGSDSSTTVGASLLSSSPIFIAASSSEGVAELVCCW